MKNKIDLSEIARIAQSLRDGHEVESGGVKSRKIATALEALLKMHEALTEISKGFGDGLVNIWLEKLESGIEKANSIMRQFGEPDEPEPQSNLVCKNDQIDRDYGF